MDERGDVIAAVAQAPLVAAPARAKDVLGDGMAVEKSLENPLGRRVQSGSYRWSMTLVQHKLATEQRRAIEVVVRRNGRGRPLDHRPQGMPWWL